MITIVTGDTNAYKTAFVEKMIREMDQVDGILSKKKFLNERFDGYYIQQISSGICKEFLSLTLPSNQRIGEFYIQEEGLLFAKKITRQAIKEKRLVVIDELGQAELSGRVFYEELNLLLKEKANAILVIRKRLLHDFQNRFPQLNQAKIIEVRNGRKEDQGLGSQA